MKLGAIEWFIFRADADILPIALRILTMEGELTVNMHTFLFDWVILLVRLAWIPADVI